MTVSASQGACWGQPWSRLWIVDRFLLFSLSREMEATGNFMSVIRVVSYDYESWEVPQVSSVNLATLLVSDMIQSNLEGLRTGELTPVCVGERRETMSSLNNWVRKKRCKFLFLIPFGLFVCLFVCFGLSGLDGPSYGGKATESTCSNIHLRVISLTNLQQCFIWHPHSSCKFRHKIDHHHMHPLWTKGDVHLWRWNPRNYEELFP